MIRRNVWAEVDLSAIAHNIKETKKILQPDTKLCAVVKANAYGHGAIPVAETVVEAGADFLAVAMTQEALELRLAGIKIPVLILGSLTPGHEETVVEYSISQAVYDLKSAELLSAAAVKMEKIAKIHLAIETGMNRIGCKVSEVGDLALAITNLPNVELEGAFSHFAKADAADKAYTQQQYDVFLEAMKDIEDKGISIPLKHIANSAAITEEPSMHMNMVRQGITLYGLWPSSEVKQKVQYKPVMTLKAKIVFIKEIPMGEKVGYGCTYETQRTTKIATLPLGYADGISRKLSNKGYVSIRGFLAPIVGTVCMDQMMVDVTDVPDVEEDDEVIIFGGNEISLDTVAQWMETINYEVACLLSPRVPRRYIFSYALKK
ncbi:MAG: alanine racemase [Acidaminococcaceae bacterium]|nr:alanine racemase [Acidaminococcaceae bacterium]MDD4722422.1 alanine racemase [Acidaminococcaceae bacterium]